MQKRLQLLIAMLVLVVSVAMAQVTTSGISGKVTSQGEEVIGATVTATHQPSGTVYRAVTNMDGRFSIQGMRPGGPYKVEVSYIGYQSKTFKDVSLNLGESQNLSCSLQEDARELQEVVVSGKAGLNGTKTGAAQSINAQQIAEMPSISHSIADIARMNAQVSTNGQSGAMSFAGTNNRYNSFQIDGVMNNDVFGLVAMAVKQVASLYLWRPSNRFRSTWLLSMFVRVVSLVVPLMRLLRVVRMCSTEVPILMATTRVW